MTRITKNIQEAAKLLTGGQVVAIPTETVYGLAGNIYHQDAVQQIYQIKKRPSFNPLIVHIHHTDLLKNLVTNIPAAAQKLADTFWPGPLTMVLPKHSSVPDSVTAGKNTVAVRIPNHPVTQELLSILSFPLAAPSANPFGSISPTKAIHVKEYFDNELAMVLDGGPCNAGIESTIIGFQDEEPVLYRQGSIAQEDIEMITGKIRILNHNSTAPEAPGMLLKHYAPLTPCIQSEDINQTILNHEDRKIGLLSFRNEYIHPSVMYQEILSPAGNLTEAAAGLYNALHNLDRCGADLIIAEKFPDWGLGKSINDRLQRACYR